MKRILFGAAISFVLATPALAQSYQDTGGSAVPAVVPVAPGLGPIFTTAHPGYVRGSFSASFGGFTPTPAYAQLTVGAASARVALPAGTVVIVYNTGANAAAVQLGGASVVATMANDIIQPGSWMAFTVGSAVDLAAIETAGATALNISGGSGLPTGAGGGSGGGGGGGAVTQSGTWTVQPGNTPNTVPWLVTGAGGTFPVTGTFWQATQPVSAASLPLPSGAATAALQTTGNTALSTINTTLGSPFQAGASIGNTGFGITGTLPAFAATPTFNLGTLNGAALAANQTNASQKTQIVDGSGNVIASTSNNLDVQCANCSGSGVSTTDNATWTAGSSLFAGTGGEYSSALPTAITNGHQALAAITQYRALWNDWYNSSGVEMGTAGSPVQVSLANTATNATAVKTSVASGGIASGALASGSVAAGAVSAGAFVSGSVLSGAYADGSLVTLGTEADTAYTGSGSATAIAIEKGIYAAAVSGTGAFGSATPTSGVAIGGTDGTDLRELLTSSTGQLHTIIDSGGGTGGTSLGDNAAWTAGTTGMTPMGCEFTSGGATAITTAHAATVGCTAARAAFADIESVGGAGSFTNYGATPGAVPAVPVNAFVTNTNANITPGDAVSTTTYGAASPTIGVPMLWNGTTYDREREGGATGSAAVAGPITSGTAQTANPLPGGGRGETAEPTAVTDGQAVAAAYTQLGKAVVQPYAIGASIVDNGGTDTTGTATAITILSASGNAAYFEYMNSIQCTRDDAGTTAIGVVVSDGTKSRTWVMPAGGGFGFTFPVGIKWALNHAVTATPNASVTGNISCNAQGHIAP